MSKRKWKVLGKIRCRQWLCFQLSLRQTKCIKDEGDISIGSYLLSLLLTAALMALSFSHSSTRFLLNYSRSLLLSSLVSTGLDLKKWKPLCIRISLDHVNHTLKMLQWRVLREGWDAIIESLPILMCIWLQCFFLRPKKHITSLDAVMKGMYAWQRIDL